MMKNIYKIMCAVAMTTLMTSCLDTIILPDDKTVDEDFWKTKEDVASMVNAAYAGLASEATVQKLIICGDFRSDEVVLSATPTGTLYDELRDMAAINMQTTSSFANWVSLYAVINRCNMVLDRAKSVSDPNYTQGDYETDRSQMLAVRALCYFLLVRDYHDVPYVAEAYMTSSQNRQLTQSTPEYVIDRCIADLEEARTNALRADGFLTSQWQRVGWMTDDAINTLLADIYLWRASFTHSAADYQKCVDYCDLVLESKKKQHKDTEMEVYNPDYPMAKAEVLYNQLFVKQNAEESIFELQMRSASQYPILYYKWANDNSGEGYLKAASMFGTTNSTISAIKPTSTVVFDYNDVRYFASIFAQESGDAYYNVRKMIATSGISTAGLQARKEFADAVKRTGLNQNYPMYRLSDVMLMKAEALVQLADDSADPAVLEEQLLEPFTLVQNVHARALFADKVTTDSMKWTTYHTYTKDQMEILVMQERLREFCFEGKRWYDLLRYNYRHVDYAPQSFSQLLSSQVDANGESTAGAIYPEMLDMATRSRGAEQPGVKAKMRNEAYLYLPVPNSDIILSPGLKQNPAYRDAVQFEKNY